MIDEELISKHHVRAMLTSFFRQQSDIATQMGDYQASRGLISIERELLNNLNNL